VTPTESSLVPGVGKGGLASLSKSKEDKKVASSILTSSINKDSKTKGVSGSVTSENGAPTNTSKSPSNQGEDGETRS